METGKRQTECIQDTTLMDHADVTPECLFHFADWCALRSAKDPASRPLYDQEVAKCGVVVIRLGLLVMPPVPDESYRTSIDTAATVCRSFWLSMLGHDSCQRASFRCC